MVLDCLRITTGGVMVRACVVFGIGAVAGALLVDCLMPEVFGDYPLAHAIAMLATAEQQLAYMLSRNQGMKYRVLIADDHAIMREGVRALLLSDGSIEVVAAVDNGRDAVRLAVALKPDLAVMELTMPQMDGLSAIRELVHRAVPTRVLVLTGHKTEEHVRASLRAGAWGYVVKDASAAELMLAIHSVAQGKKFVSPVVTERIVTGYLSADTGQAGGSPADVLTPREKEVLKLIAAGRRNREIAGCLSLSVKTVEQHRANVMKKLGLHNTAALTAFAINDATLSAT